MLEKTALMLAVTMALAACNNGDCKKETEKLKTEIGAIKKELAELRKASPGKTGNDTKEETDDAEKPTGSIDAAALKVKGGLMGARKQTEVAVKLTNNSSIFLDYADVTALGYNKNDEFLGKCLCAYYNVRPGKSKVETCTILEVPLRQVHRVHVVPDAPLGTEDKKQLKFLEGDWRRK